MKTSATCDIARSNSGLWSGWRSGRASDSESRDPGFDPHWRHCVVSLSKAMKKKNIIFKKKNKTYNKRYIFFHLCKHSK